MQREREKAGFSHLNHSITKRGASTNSTAIDRAPGARSISDENCEAPLLLLEIISSLFEMVRRSCCTDPESEFGLVSLGSLGGLALRHGTVLDEYIFQIFPYSTVSRIDLQQLMSA